VDGGGLDGWAEDFVISRFSDPGNALRVTGELARARVVADRSAEIAGEVEKAETLAQTLADRLGRGEITLKRYDAAVGPLDRHIAELQAEAKTLKPTASGPTAVMTRAEATQMWEDASPTDRRTLLRQALAGRKIIVNPANPSAPRAFDAGRVVVR
jgi:site-specific DNA recombinase